MVYDKISKNNDIGLNELWNLILKESDPNMSKPTLVKVVKNLARDGLIGIVKEGKQKYHLTTDLDFAESMTGLVDTFESILTSHEKKLQRLEAAIKDLPIMKKANLLIRFLHMVQITDWKLAAVSEIVKLRKLNEHRKRLECLKGKLLVLTTGQLATDPFPVMLIMNKIESAMEMKLNMELDADLNTRKV